MHTLDVSQTKVLGGIFGAQEDGNIRGNGGNDIKRSFLTCTPRHGRVCLTRGGQGEGNT
jgi:hypothetical protein